MLCSPGRHPTEECGNRETRLQGPPRQAWAGVPAPLSPAGRPLCTPGPRASWCSDRSWPPREVVRVPPGLLEWQSGHLPAHEIAENVEAVQVGVLAAPVHIATGDRLAQLVWVGEYGQHIICGGRGGGEPG